VTLFWHFSDPPPPVWHFSIFDDWFLGLNCFEILNKFKIKYLLNPYLALWQKDFLPKALKTVFQRAKKEVWHFVDPPLRVSRIIWMSPKYVSFWEEGGVRFDTKFFMLFEEEKKVSSNSKIRLQKILSL
jgi:hypothetical protein